MVSTSPASKRSDSKRACLNPLLVLRSEQIKPCKGADAPFFRTFDALIRLHA